MTAMVPPPARTLLTVREAADVARVSESTIWRALRDGSLPATRIYRCTRVWSTDLDLFLRLHRAPQCRDLICAGQS
jgi:excisionase family DNA binding protein